MRRAGRRRPGLFTPFFTLSEGVLLVSIPRDGKVLISGYAKLPAHITSEEIYHTVVLVVTVDLQMGTILGAECSLTTELAKSFVSDLMVGYNMASGPAAMIDRFDSCYFGQAKKALVTALKMVFAKYDEIMAELSAQ